ncbi:MAG: ribonuclease HII, partial [Candidatus Omnitrophica bacterium]|nr:ribonuclease HII [Candidatus Omnitrophota bacterium]
AFDEHKGYGTAQHRLALAEHGASVLHRLSFRPVVTRDTKYEIPDTV